MSAIEIILSKLERAKRTGTGRWMARCPSHPDKTPSLSLRELNDGRLLVHCFAGCHVGEVLAAIGLSVTDLFPERLPDGRLERRPFPAADVLRAIALEAQIVSIVAADVAKGIVIDTKTKDRVLLACGRINSGLVAGGINCE
jgi:hypothetical protein